MAFLWREFSGNRWEKHKKQCNLEFSVHSWSVDQRSYIRSYNVKWRKILEMFNFRFKRWMNDDPSFWIFRNSFTNLNFYGNFETIKNFWIPIYTWDSLSLLKKEVEKSMKIMLALFNIKKFTFSQTIERLWRDFLNWVWSVMYVCWEGNFKISK
jgi:hypothetical protein